MLEVMETGNLDLFPLPMLTVVGFGCYMKYFVGALAGELGVWILSIKIDGAHSHRHSE